MNSQLHYYYGQLIYITSNYRNLKSHIFHARVLSYSELMYITLHPCKLTLHPHATVLSYSELMYITLHPCKLTLHPHATVHYYVQLM